MLENSTPVLVLRSAHHGGLAIARTLGRLGIPVYVVDANPQTPVFFSRFCRGKFLWDLDKAPVDDSIEYLSSIGRKLGRPALLIPTTDTAALFVAANAAALSPWFIFSRQSPRLVQSLHSKEEMYRLAKGAGVPTPETFFPQSAQDALNFAQSATFPLILKPIVDRNSKNPAARGKVIVRSRKQLLDTYDAMENPEQPNVLFQEFIPGGEEASWMFNGYFDGNSECLFGLAGRKIRQNPPYAGITSLGVCMPNPAVEETTRKFMKAIGYQGILDLGYRFDARDGRYKVFDVNPRIGCTFRLFASDSGMDVARAQYLDVTGQPVDAGLPVPGRKWIVESLDLASAFRYWRDGNLTAGSWLRSLYGIEETASFASDDPSPMLSMWVNDCRALTRRLGARLQPASSRLLKVTVRTSPAGIGHA